MFIRKLSINTLLFALGPQLPRIVGIALLPILTRYLTPIDYAVSGVVFSYSALLMAGSDLGFSVLMMNSFYDHPTKWRYRWGQFHAVLSSWNLLYGVLVGFIIFLIVPNEAAEHRMDIAMLVGIPVCVFQTTNLMSHKFYQFSAQPLYITIVSGITGSASIVITYWLVVHEGLGYMAWFWASATTAMLSSLLYAYPIYSRHRILPIFKLKTRYLIRNLKITLPMLPHVYSDPLLSTSDRIVMERVGVSASPLGQYNFAYQIGSYINFLGGAVGTAIGPLFTKLYSDNTEEHSKQAKVLTEWLQQMFIAGTFLVALFAKDIFGLLVNNADLAAAYPIAVIVIMSYCYRPYYWCATARLMYSEKTGQLWRITMLGGVLNVVLNLIFVPIYGVMAAAVTTFVSLLYVGFSGHYMKVYKRLEKETYFPGRYILAIVLLTVAVFLLKDITLAGKLPIAGVALSLAAWSTSHHWSGLKQIAWATHQ